MGKLADRIIAHAGSLLHEGADWNDVQARICDFMVRNEVIPVDEGAMLFGGAYEADEFIPDLFRTRGNRALRRGDIVILETQGIHDGFWVDINRTAVVGKASAEYRHQHDVLRDAFLKMVDHLRPGVSTASLPAIGYEHLKANGIATPEKLLVVAHGIGLMPLEIPLAFPAAGLAGVKQGFVMEEDADLARQPLLRREAGAVPHGERLRDHRGRSRTDVRGPARTVRGGDARACERSMRCDGPRRAAPRWIAARQRRSQ
ncbi:M24 family metallopeptidase [Novosphingobium resinovorum]